MSQVIYRKHRPQTFSEVVGQKHIVQTLKNALTMDNVAHAYLFAGPRGTGKTTMARLLTKALNCAGMSGKLAEPCQKCESCKAIEEGSFVDLIEIDAASNRGINEIRELRDAVRFAPNKADYKVYLIDEVHMLTDPAFNALLKTLEEPPEHTVFILATTEPHKVPATIISRTQRFNFQYLPHEEIKSRIQNILKSEKKSLDDESVSLIISAAGGSLRDAESILGKVLAVDKAKTEDIRELLGITDFSVISGFFDIFAEGDKEKALAHIGERVTEGANFNQLIEGIVEYARTLLYLKLSPSSKNTVTEHLSQDQVKQASHHAEQLTEVAIYSIIKEFLEAGQSIKYAPLPQIPVELAVVNVFNSSQ